MGMWPDKADDFGEVRLPTPLLKSARLSPAEVGPAVDKMWDTLGVALLGLWCGGGVMTFGVIIAVIWSVTIGLLLVALAVPILAFTIAPWVEAYGRVRAHNEAAKP